MLLTKDGQRLESEFHLVDAADDDQGQAGQADGKEIVPLNRLLNGSGNRGVWLDVDDDPEALEPYLPDLEVIAVNFPAFNDGRGYSAATILRSRYAFKGELRAIGDVRVDQLEQMLRCGFDTFALAAGQDLDLATRLLKGFPFNYQQTTDREPLFRQRDKKS